MPLNNIALIRKYAPEKWDAVYKQESVVSLLDSDKDLVRFSGARVVKVAKFQGGGLHNYYRNNLGEPTLNVPPANGDFVGAADFGYQRSSVRLVWEEFTLRQDRAAAYEIEAFDDEESGGNLVGRALVEVNRTLVVPEIDAYTLSTIADATSENLGNKVKEDIVARPIAALNRALTYFANNEVPAEDQIIFASPDFVNALRSTDEVTKFLGQSDFGTGKDTKFEITRYQGRDIVTVSPQRLRTHIDMSDTRNGGFRWAKDSEAINFLVVAKSAVYHVVKYEQNKIISGELNLASRGFDGYTVFARIYHDVFVPDNKRVALYCSVKSTPTPAPEMKLDIVLKNDKVIGITTLPAEKLSLVVTSDTDETVGNKATGTLTLVDVGYVADKSTTTNFYAIDNMTDKTVLAKQEYKGSAAE
ncbi:hypothetical protein [Mammaliicoccus vitulinus]|uniref:hypothetical protein n=1 Tax=Mammaliicoccus vitulinus TaxID=71237 RepID=UPI00248D1699|nr:hypothetical protein [Mammaliicoccus vitulinus]